MGLGRIFGQDNVIGYWKGSMIKEEAPMEVSFELKSVNGKINAYFNSPTLKKPAVFRLIMYRRMISILHLN